MSDEVGEARAHRAQRRPVLFVRAGRRSFALPLSCVRETMRPLPIEPLPDLPAFVRGLSLVRGRLLPVVTLARWSGSAGALEPGRRFVTVEADSRCFALEVDEVRGIAELAADELEGLPPLARGLEDGVVEAVRARDTELLFVLEAARLLPEKLTSISEGAP